jgi:hypothetical protein
LPPLPSKLAHLACMDNRLQSLPELPTNLQTFQLDMNPFPRRLQAMVAKGEAQVCVINRCSYLSRMALVCIAMQYTLGKVLPQDCLGIVGSFCTGQSGSLTQQIAGIKLAYAT